MDKANNTGEWVRPTDKIWVEEVIIATVLRRGEGKVPHDPVRIITQVFSKDGTLIAELDPYLPTPK